MPLTSIPYDTSYLERKVVQQLASRLRRLHKDTWTSQPVAQRLPPEILLLIFSEFGWQVTDEPCIPVVGKDCPWFEFVRMHKSLSLVCHTWHDVAMSKLYSLVYIYRVGQLPALVRILEDRFCTNRDITHWVKEIRCECYVPKMWHGVYFASINWLIARCRAIRRLTYVPVFDDQKMDTLNQETLNKVYIQSLERAFPDLLELTVGNGIRLGSLRFLGLRKLHLTAGLGFYRPEICSRFTLPNLESLHCDFTTTNYDENTRIIADHWTLPRLQDLTMNVTLRSRASGNGSLNFDFPEIQPPVVFCEAHGAHLRILVLGKCFDQKSFSKNLSRLFSLCPELTHISYPSWLVPALYLPVDVSMGSPPNSVHSKLRSVTFFGENFDGTYSHLSDFSQRWAFPSLDTIVITGARLSGTSVDARILPDNTGETLHHWATKLKALGIRFLNRESQPINIELSDRIDVIDDIDVIDLVDTDESDEDYESETYESRDYSNVGMDGSDEEDDSGSDDSDSSEASGSYESESNGLPPETDDGSGLGDESPHQLDFEEALKIFRRTLRTPRAIGSCSDGGSDTGVSLS